MLTLPGSRRYFVLPVTVALLATAGPDLANAAGRPNVVKPAACGAGPLTKAQQRRDTDRDGRPNWRDGDVDGDGRRNGSDRDVDGDGIPNSRDRDVDGDGIPNSRDRDVDGDGVPNSRDPDVDGDGIPNSRDPDIDGDGTPNRIDPDADGDCQLNARDSDVDGDQVPDTADADPFASGAVSREARASTSAGVRVPASFFGLVSNEAAAQTGAQRDDVMRAIRAAGAGTVRQKLDWATVERAPGRYDFSGFDDFMLGAARAGIEVLPILFNPPPFYSSDPGADGTAPPRDNADFARFADAAVRRYGRGGTLWAEHPDVPAVAVSAWQVWNEPNFKAYWPSGPNPAAYTAMLRAVSAAIRGADPTAQVVAGGLPESYSGMPVADFVNGMYAAGAKGSFDVLAVHAYARSAEQTIDILANARKVLDAHGDTQLPLWVTELGWASDGPAAPYTVGADDQAALVRRVLPALVQQRDQLHLQGVVYYAWQDAPPYMGGKDFWGLHTGLHEIDGRPKPALQAFTDTARSLTAS